MGTVLEGSWDECLAVVTRCFRELERDCRRISLNLKVDYRAGASGRLEAKIASVEKRLGRPSRSNLTAKAQSPQEIHLTLIIGHWPFVISSNLYGGR